MKVLLTGASSFTGFWFARTLSEKGAQVVAPLRGGAAAYEGVRASRVKRLAGFARILENVPFGSDAFMALVEREPFDVLCHHAAQVTNYRSMDFDAHAALINNTLNLRRVLVAMRGRGTKVVVVTGSVFEQDEGLGDPPRGAFSPYGLSKGLTWQVFRYWSSELGLPAAKFVIPNPFGAFEEPRFIKFLIDHWRSGETAEVRTPLYLRDNIHVDLLALAYADFVSRLAASPDNARIGVSGYRETQGAFAERVAAEMRPRLHLDCRVVLPRQTEFSEPMVRLNPDLPDIAALGWDEVGAWDGLAEYYRE